MPFPRVINSLRRVIYLISSELQHMHCPSLIRHFSFSFRTLARNNSTFANFYNSHACLSYNFSVVDKLAHLRTNTAQPTRADLQKLLGSSENLSLTDSEYVNLLDFSKKEQWSHSFWNMLLSTARNSSQENLVKSLCNCIKNDLSNHGNATVLQVMEVMIEDKDFEAFSLMKNTLWSRLSQSEHIVFAQPVAQLICRTPFCTEAIDLLPFIKSDVTKYNIWNCICEGVVTFHEFKIVFENLKTLANNFIRPRADFFAIFFDRIKVLSRHEDAIHWTHQLLEQMKNYHWIVSDIAASHIASYFRRKLERWEFTRDEIGTMSREFFDTVFTNQTKDTLYLATTPVELQSLSKFLDEQSAPFDCIVDFLNVMHTHRIKFDARQAGLEFTNLLRQLKSKLNMNRICLVGKGNSVSRKSAFWAPIRELGNRIGISVFEFSTKSNTKDDLFMLYMALWSGPRCYILSNDEFRQNRALLSSSLASKLSQWQVNRQIDITRSSNNPFLMPTECDVRVHGSPSVGWHIPYYDSSQKITNIPKPNWLCIRPPK